MLIVLSRRSRSYNRKIITHVDSQVLYYALSKGRCSARYLMILTRHYAAIELSQNLTVIPVWIPSEFNSADAHSRHLRNSAGGNQRNDPKRKPKRRESISEFLSKTWHNTEKIWQFRPSSAPVFCAYIPPNPLALRKGKLPKIAFGATILQLGTSRKTAAMTQVP